MKRGNSSPAVDSPPSSKKVSSGQANSEEQERAVETVKELITSDPEKAVLILQLLEQHENGVIRQSEGNIDQDENEMEDANYEEDNGLEESEFEDEEEHDEETKSFKLPAQLDGMDFLSRANDDNLFKIISEGDRDALNNLGATNQKLYCLTNYDKLKKPKNVAHALVIQKMSIRSDIGQALYLYTTSGNGDRLSYEISNKDEETKKKVRAQWSPWCGMKGGLQETMEVRDEICVMMKELLCKYAPKKLELISVHLDKSLFDNILSAFQGQIPTYLILSAVSVEEESELKEFIMRQNVKELSVQILYGDMFDWFDEKFIREFSLNGSSRQKLKVADPYDRVGECWYPSSELLPFLCRYAFLYILTLKMHVNQVQALVKIGLASTSDFTLYLGIEDLFDENDLSDFEINQADLYYTNRADYRRMRVHKADRICQVSVSRGQLFDSDGLILCARFFQKREDSDYEDYEESVFR